MRVEIPNQITVTIGGLISRGVKAVEVTDAGKLIFTLTDGSVIDLGSVMGPQGPKGETGPEGPAGPAGVKGDTGAAGASIMSIEKSSQSGTTSTYTITMSDGQTFDFEVQSDKGEKGDKGDTGATGPKGPQGEQGQAGIVVQETEPTGPEHPVWVNPKGSSSGGSGGGYNIGSGLKLDAATNTLSVDTAAAVEKDNTKPVTSAAVYTEVGNINALLATI